MCHKKDKKGALRFRATKALKPHLQKAVICVILRRQPQTPIFIQPAAHLKSLHNLQHTQRAREGKI
jgi:hypothetical protein